MEDPKPVLLLGFLPPALLYEQLLQAMLRTHLEGVVSVYAGLHKLQYHSALCP